MQEGDKPLLEQPFCDLLLCHLLINKRRHSAKT